jgi:galactose mutarotase-like enzyme
MEGEIKTMPTPLEINTLEGDSLSVDPLGAKFEVTLGNEKILTKITRGDGKIGATHPCSPIFDQDLNNVYGLSRHGNMRNEPCNVSLSKPNEATVKHDVSDPGYPEGMKVEEKLKVENGVFSLQITHRNTGQEKAAVNTGIHCYFAAPEGFTGTKVNGQDITELIKNNPNGTMINLSKENMIEIPGKPTLTLKQNGFNYAFVWTGANPQTGEIDNDYVCIEPIEMPPDRFGSEESMIQQGKERTSSLFISKAS